MPVSVYVVLLHHPVVNRHGVLVTSAVTNLDLHDISRTARTYGARGFFVVTPVEDQHVLVGRILNHWKSEENRLKHPDRAEALSLVRLAKDFDAVLAAIESETGQKPEVVLTDARPIPHAEEHSVLREELKSPDRFRPVALVFGTAWGISETFYPRVDRVLRPVYGQAEYNHLSVRAAAAVIMDRLLGT